MLSKKKKRKKNLDTEKPRSRRYGLDVRNGLRYELHSRSQSNAPVPVSKQLRLPEACTIFQTKRSHQDLVSYSARPVTIREVAEFAILEDETTTMQSEERFE